MIRQTILLFLAVTLCGASGCAVNPVTGQRELALVSEQRELAVGAQQYLPSRQMQGGDHTVDPELSRYVDQVGQRLAAVSDRQLPYEFKVLNNSIPNAWALPGGKIAVNRGLLLELGSEAELAAVLGHEIVHAAARHGAKGMERGMILQGAVLVAGIASSSSDYSSLAVGGAALAANLVSQKYGRDAERQSDLYGMEYMARAGYDPTAAVSLQEVFVRLSENQRQDWLSGLFASHPPSQERVDNNRKIAARLAAGGELGRERFLEKTAQLRKTKQAYEQYEKGRKALDEGRLDEALQLADAALREEPREALFHGLRGDIRFTLKRYPDALINYDRALDHNSEFFQFYVQRGLTREALGDKSGAQTDMEKSLTLLPTAIATNALGNMALAGGNRKKALQYFKTAASSNSNSGRQALASLVRLDLPANPGKYLQSRTALNRQGMLIAEITNPTPLAVQNLRVAIRITDNAGKSRAIVRDVRGPIEPGKNVLINTGMGPFKDGAGPRGLQLEIQRATIADH